MVIYYDYRESDGTYRESSSKTFYTYLLVSDCVHVPKTLVTASLESGGESGEDLIVKAIITNIGTKTMNYVVNVAGYSTWAESASSEPNVLTSVESGASREVLITLTPKEDALGIQTFNLEVLSDGRLELTQPIEIEILEKEKALDLSDLFGDNWYLWLIGALNIILVLIIIIVAIRISKKE